MKELLRRVPLGIVLALLVAACGQVPTPEPKAPVSPTPQPTPVPTPPWPAESQPLIDLAVADLAGMVNASVDRIAVVRVEAVDWPDGCLGCAKAGEFCTEAIVPGYRVVLEVGGQEYEYRADRQRTVRPCPAKAAAADWGAATPLVKMAISDVMGLLAVPADEVQVISVERQEWRDSSLGCPEPGKGYLMVITPGYQIILEVRGARYDYRTSDKLVRLCKGATQ